MPFWMSIFFSDSNSPSMEFLLFFHDLVMILIIMMIMSLMLLFLMLMNMKYFSEIFPESQSLEDLWLIIPITFLIFIGMPSIKNLYMCEEFNECDMSIKVMGNQWYWTYEMMNMKINFDSIMKNENFLFRLMETYNHLILPIKSLIMVMVSSNDVIHSWTLPSLGIKNDAIPGRINHNIFMINRPGIIMGQCSEICGSSHSFMPIMVSANLINNFIK